MCVDSKTPDELLATDKSTWIFLTITKHINPAFKMDTELQKRIIYSEQKLAIYDIYKKYNPDPLMLHHIRYVRALNYFMKTQIESMSIDRESLLQTILDDLKISVSQEVQSSLKDSLEKDFENRKPLLLERMIQEHTLWSYHSRNLQKLNATDTNTTLFPAFGRYQTQVYEYPFIKFWFLMSTRRSKKTEVKVAWEKIHAAFKKELLALRPEYRERYEDENNWRNLQNCFGDTLNLVLLGIDVPPNFKSEDFPWLLKMMYDYIYNTVATNETYLRYAEYIFFYLESILWGNTISNLIELKTLTDYCPMAHFYYLDKDPSNLQKINMEINNLYIEALKNENLDWAIEYNELMFRTKQQCNFFVDYAYWNIRKLDFEDWKKGRLFCGNAYRLNVGNDFLSDQDSFHLDRKKVSTIATPQKLSAILGNDLNLMEKISRILIDDNNTREATIKSIRNWHHSYLHEDEKINFPIPRDHVIRKRFICEFINFILYDKRQAMIDLYGDEHHLWIWEITSTNTDDIKKIKNQKRSYEFLRNEMERCLWTIEYQIPLKLPHTSKSPKELYELLHKEFDDSIFYTPISELDPWKKR